MIMDKDVCVCVCVCVCGGGGGGGGGDHKSSFYISLCTPYTISFSHISFVTMKSSNN